jgi:hypothetical protein
VVRSRFACLLLYLPWSLKNYQLFNIISICQLDCD